MESIAKDFPSKLATGVILLVTLTVLGWIGPQGRWSRAIAQGSGPKEKISLWRGETQLRGANIWLARIISHFRA